MISFPAVASKAYFNEVSWKYVDLINLAVTSKDIYIYTGTYIYWDIYIEKPLKPTTSTDRPPLTYIDCFISVPNECSYRYVNSLNRPPP